MPLHFNSTVEDFGKHLYDAALRNGASAQVFDLIERIMDYDGDVAQLEKEASEAGEERAQAERFFADMRERLTALVKAVEKLKGTSPEVRAALSAARAELAIHDEKD